MGPGDRAGQGCKGRPPPPAGPSGSCEGPDFSAHQSPAPAPLFTSESSREPERQRAQQGALVRSPWGAVVGFGKLPGQFTEACKEAQAKAWGGGFGLRASATDPVTEDTASGSLSCLFCKMGVMISPGQARGVAKIKRGLLVRQHLETLQSPHACPRSHYYNVYLWENGEDKHLGEACPSLEACGFSSRIPQPSPEAGDPLRVPPTPSSPEG